MSSQGNISEQNTFCQCALCSERVELLLIQGASCLSSSCLCRCQLSISYGHSHIEEFGTIQNLLCTGTTPVFTQRHALNK